MAGMVLASRSQAVIVFLLYLILGLALLGLIPVIAYRLYALWVASYSLERDGLRIHWGFRSEDVPINKILWVRSVDELGVSLPVPFVRWPGSVIGTRYWHNPLREGRAYDHLPGGGFGEPGAAGDYRVPIEFLAGKTSVLVLIATAERIFAISPDDKESFLAAFRQVNEMGSLTPLPPQSVRPGFLFSEIQGDRVARILILAGFLLALLLLAWVIFTIPGREQISLRTSAARLPVDYVPAIQLLLLPVLNLLFFLADASLGLFFYRRPEIRPLSYLLWANSVVVSLLFGGAIYFIVRMS
jgi:hypothetical protein